MSITEEWWRRPGAKVIVGILGWFVTIPDLHKAAMIGVVVVTLMARFTFLMIF
jgi:hypothetical protein